MNARYVVRGDQMQVLWTSSVPRLVIVPSFQVRSDKIATSLVSSSSFAFPDQLSHPQFELVLFCDIS